MDENIWFLVFAGVATLGAIALICWAYVWFTQSETKIERRKLLIGILAVVLLAIPCSVVAFVGHGFIDVDSETLDWVKAITSWIAVPPLFYLLVYRLAYCFRSFRTYPSRCWSKLAYSGVLMSWAFEALMMYELSKMS